MGIAEYIENAWAAYKRNFRTIVGAQILALAIIFLMMALSAIGLVLSMGPSSALTEEAILEGQISIDMSSPYFILSIMGFFVTMLVALVLRTGLVRIYADSLMKKKTSIESMFSVAKEKAWTAIGAWLSVIVFLATAAIIVFVPTAILLAVNEGALAAAVMAEVVAFVLVAILFSLINPAIVVGNCKAMDAVRKSYATVKSNYLSFLGLVLIFLVLSSVLNYMEVIGTILSLLLLQPVTELAYTSFYMDKAAAKRAAPAKKKAGTSKRKAKK